MQRFLLSVLITCFAIQANANHFTGAHLRYEFVSAPMTYRIHLTLYKTCEAGAIDLPTFINVFAESKLNNAIVNKNLIRVTNDTLQPFCRGTVTSCENISSAYPGYIAAVYSDTIKLPSVASDWFIVFNNSNRNFGITNLQGASGQSFYVEAPIKINYNNTSAVMPDYPPHVMFVNDSLKVPLTAYDADGDSIDYQFVQPISGPGMGIPYYTGYSASLPFGNGGLCYIDGSNNMVLKSTATGKYTLAMRINEYRNGTLVGYTIRDFIVICISTTAGNILSTPTPASTSNMLTYTCPGRNNQLNFSFTDPNQADSVYIQIMPPTLPGGWTFNTSATPGIGSASGSITWTTPASVNPSQLPIFNINVAVRDNSCRLQGKATYVYTVMLRDCGADSVWPGDANADKIVDLYDPLAIALTYNDTGAARTSATTNWNAEYCDFWNGSFLNNIDKKHADCNGDGIVTSADLGAVALNYGKVHAKGPRRKTTAATKLYFDHTGIDPNPDSTVSIKIMLGNSTNQVNGLYGLAANITVDGLSLATPPTITYSSSWLGNGTNTMSFTKEVSPTSTDWAYARTDKQNTSGQGQVANVEFKIPASTPGGTLVTLSFDKARFIDKDGLELQDIGILDDTFYVRHPATVKNINQNDWQVQIYPNPSGGTASLHVLSANRTDANITVKDITGKTISTTNKLLETGSNTISLSGDMLTPGIYMVYISGTGHSGKVIKWVIQ